MIPDTDILPVAFAWRAVGKRDTDMQPDDFATFYVAGAVEMMVQRYGHADQRRETFTEDITDGVAATITTPWASATVVSVVSDDGTTQSGWSFTAPTLTGTFTGTQVTITARSLPVPMAWQIAAGQVCRQIYLADTSTSGGRPTDGGGQPVPTGFAWPARTLELMERWEPVGGFA